MDASQGTISLSELPDFKKEYERAVADGSELFKFKGMDVLTSYAKYMIEHLENEKKRHNL